MKVRGIKIGLFALIGFLIFLPVQEILTPDWTHRQSMGCDATAVINGFNALEDNTVDVLFVGSSSIHDGISPMKLYEETNISSYNMSVSGQTMGTNYYMLKYAFETQKPKVVFLNALNLYGEEYNVPWRYIADNLPLSTLKIEIA